MTTNKDLLMQPLSDEELAGVNGGAGRSAAECEFYCGKYKKPAPMAYMKCIIACKSGKPMDGF